MTRFLIVPSMVLIAGSLAILPVASFAQTGGTAPIAAPVGGQSAGMQTAAPTKPPVVMPAANQDKIAPAKAAPAETAKSEMVAPMGGKAPAHKTTTHATNKTVKHHTAHSPVKDSAKKG